jgi:PAS domain S-box-containing protein
MSTPDRQLPAHQLPEPAAHARPDSGTVAIAVCMVVGLALSALAYRHFAQEDQERLQERLQRGSQTLATYSTLNPQPPAYQLAVRNMRALRQLVLDGAEPTPEFFAEHSWEAAAESGIRIHLRYLPRVTPDASGRGLQMLDFRGKPRPLALTVLDYSPTGMVPAAPANEYYPILFETTNEPASAVDMQGVNHFADLQFHLLLDQVRDGGDMATRTAFPLPSTHLPYVTTHSYIALYTPGPMPTTIQERRARHTGFISVVDFMPANSFINLIPESYLGFETAFIPHTDSWDLDSMDNVARSILASGNYTAEEFSKNGKRTHIITQPSVELVQAMATPQRWWALSIGLLITTWVCSLLYLSRQRSQRLAALVDARTRDLAERSQRLSESERRYRMVADNVLDVIFTHDLCGNCTWISPSIEQQSGQRAESYLGRPVWTTCTPESAARYRDAMAALLAESGNHEGTPSSMTLELLIVRSDGSLKTVEATLSLLHDPITGEQGFLGVGRDISERKQAETERVALEGAFHQAQKLEAIGTLAGGIAHDFNNLLTGMLGHAELLKSNPASVQDVATSASVIETAALRARELTSQLLGYARKGHYQNVEVNLQEVLDETINLIQRTLGKHIRIKREYPPTPLYVRGDPGQLHQVLLNLAVNARDAMPQGGTLHMRLRAMEFHAPLPLVHQEQLPPGRYCEIAVSDTGVGILPQHLSRIFDPFFTDKPKGQGTGLGLAMVYGVTRNHGGGVQVESTPGAGTTFTVYLPLTDAPQPTAAEKPQQPSAGHGHILLMDDEAQIRELSALLLDRLGYSVELAEDGVAGLERFRQRQRPFDLVIVDMNMPNMGGPECVKQLVQLDPAVRIVLATGFSQRDLGDLLCIPNVRGFLQKPFMLKELADLLEQCLD